MSSSVVVSPQRWKPTILRGLKDIPPKTRCAENTCSSHVICLSFLDGAAFTPEWRSAPEPFGGFQQLRRPRATDGGGPSKVPGFGIRLVGQHCHACRRIVAFYLRHIIEHPKHGSLLESRAFIDGCPARIRPSPGSPTKLSPNVSAIFFSVPSTSDGLRVLPRFLPSRSVGAASELPGHIRDLIREIEERGSLWGGGLGVAWPSLLGFVGV